MPDAMTEATDELSPSTPPPAHSADITVLVVDDEASNLASLEKIFQREGMRVLTADGAKGYASSRLTAPKRRSSSCAAIAFRSCSRI